MQKQMAVAIVDDDPEMLDTLKALLQIAGRRVQTYDCGSEFLDEFDPADCGCVILDLNMPGLDGLEVQNQLIENGEAVPLLFLTGNANVPTAVKAVKQGAFDFIQKPFENDQILDKVENALKMSEELIIERHRRAEIEKRMQRLTAREREVMELLSQGLPNKIVAQKLDISHRTVEVHRGRIMLKMDVSSVAHLAKMLIDIEARDTRH